MRKQLYFECLSGISGDMTVAALIDLGVNEKVLIDYLKTLPLDGYTLSISRVKKNGIDCCDFNVILETENHDHDMEYLHSHEHYKKHEGEHLHHHSHEHRGLQQIEAIINNSSITQNAKLLSLKIFNIIAEAESKAHGIPKENVHFHEVGAIDSIIDIVAVSICIDELGIDEFIFSPLSEGKGTINCQHGILPIPVPAVSNIVSMYNIPLSFIDENGEFVTPTGAAIVAALNNHTMPSVFSIEKIGLGAGKRTYNRPSMLRVMIINSQEDADKKNDCIVKIETNIDDCSGESLGYLMNLLFANGARDVHYHPVYMKKNRPAWQLNVICTKNDIDVLKNIIFKNSTTIGIRYIEMKRDILPREIISINTEWGIALVKKCIIDEETRYYPEYESVVTLCEVSGYSYNKMYTYVITKCL